MPCARSRSANAASSSAGNGSSPNPEIGLRPLWRARSPRSGGARRGTRQGHPARRSACGRRRAGARARVPGGSVAALGGVELDHARRQRRRRRERGRAWRLEPVRAGAESASVQAMRARSARRPLAAAQRRRSCRAGVPHPLPAARVPRGPRSGSPSCSASVHERRAAVVVTARVGDQDDREGARAERSGPRATARHAPIALGLVPCRHDDDARWSHRTPIRLRLTHRRRRAIACRPSPRLQNVEQVVVGFSARSRREPRFGAKQVVDRARVERPLWSYWPPSAQRRAAPRTASLPESRKRASEGGADR